MKEWIEFVEIFNYETITKVNMTTPQIGSEIWLKETNKIYVVRGVSHRIFQASIVTTVFIKPINSNAEHCYLDNWKKYW